MRAPRPSQFILHLTTPRSGEDFTLQHFSLLTFLFHPNFTTGVRIPVGTRKFAHFQKSTPAEGHTQLSNNRTPSFIPGGEAARCVMLTTHLHVDQRLRMSGAIGEWAVENDMKINPGKNKAVSFTKASGKERIRYYFGDPLISKVSSFKYLGIIIRSDLNWADVIYTLRKAWKALHFIMRILKNGHTIIIRNVQRIRH